MPKLINIPDFMESEVLDKKLNIFKTLILLIKSRILILIYKHTSGSLFCILINLFYKKNGKIFYSNNLYYKKINNNKFYYPNKRITRIVADHLWHFERLRKTYCLDLVNIKENDNIVDCGANVGELGVAINLNNLNINYYAFEPDLEVFKCLEKNTITKKIAFNIALSNSEGFQTLYLDSAGGNTSLSKFGNAKEQLTKITKLDLLNLKNIKLLKIDAEGFEPEVIEGCLNTLSEIEFISVDYGNERGLNEDSTIVSVVDMLYKNNFHLIAESNVRKVGLFKNQKKT